MRALPPARYESPLQGGSEKCLWREDGPSGRMEILWQEVTRVSVGKVNTIDRVERVLQVDHESGHYLEFNEAWPGFDAVCASIQERLPGVRQNWLQESAEASVEDMITVWLRDDYPR